MMERISKAAMSAAERKFRSRLNQIVSGAGLLRGTLNVRKIRCGKAGCRCTKGEPHLALYLTANENGKTRQLYIPKSQEAAARRWIRQYQQAKELLEEISLEHWDKLKKKRT